MEVVESYGSVEMGVMAHETPARDGLNLCEDLTYFEFLDEEGLPVPPGETGKVVVTDLAGSLMPFIRYEQGDQVEYREAEDNDGNRVVRITRVLGREDDFAVMPDGSRRAHDDFVAAIGKYSDIYQYRIIQEQLDLFKIEVVSDKSYFAAINSDLLESLRSRFPPDVNFEIEQVGRLDPDPGGKLRKLICMIQ